MTCPVCQAELKPDFIETLEGNKARRTLWYKGKQELASYCPNAVRHDGHGANLWTATWIKCWLRMQKRLEKFKPRKEL